MEEFGEEMFEEMAKKPEAQSFMPWTDDDSLQEFKQREVAAAKKNEKSEDTAQFDAIEEEAKGYTFGDFSALHLQGTKNLPDSAFSEGLGIEEKLPSEVSAALNEKTAKEIKEVFTDFKKELKEMLDEFRTDFKKELKECVDKK